MFAQIIGTGSYLPARMLSNDELAQKVDTSDDWISTRTGIRQRHIAADGEQTSDLALEASRAALKAAGVDATAIDLIIVATTSPDMVFPSVACTLQDKLGIYGCAAFDVQAVCAGFVYALTTADQFIRSGMATCALVVGAEVFSRLLDWEDRSTCVLFGDGAGAVVLRGGDREGIIGAHLHADGRFRHLLNVPARIESGGIKGNPYLYMDGPAVFKFASTALAAAADEVLKKHGLHQSDIDWLVPHQANLRIIEMTARKLGLPMERVIVTLAQHGNTSAASVPLALDTAVRDGRIRSGDLLLLEGIGGGFAWGSVLLRWL